MLVPTFRVVGIHCAGETQEKGSRAKLHMSGQQMHH